MKIPILERMTGTRAGRTALYCAILVLVGAILLFFGAKITGLSLIGAAIALAVVFYLTVVRAARAPRDCVLTLRLGGAIPEEPRRTLFDQIMGRSAPALSHIRFALETAKNDHALRAVLVEIAGIENGLATAEELHDLLGAVRTAGKRVIAVIDADMAGVKDYLIACAADEVVANPDTMFAMLGVSAGGVFLKRALEKLRVQVQTLQWKEYKGAAETLSRETMSPALRESMETIVGDWREVICNRIAAARKLEPDRVREIVGLGFLSAADARGRGLIDREGYTEDIRSEFEPDPKHRVTMPLSRYLRRASYLAERSTPHTIAVVCGIGPVLAGEAHTPGEFISPVTTGAQIHRAARDESVKAIVFRVNSPGGSAVGSDLVWRAVRFAQSKGKPVVVSMGDVAGSGGYYVAMGADAIVAHPSTLTGSIGVVYAKFDLSRLLNETGVSIEMTKSHPSSDAFSLTRAMTEAELHQLDEVIGQVYANFTRKVSEGRMLDAEAAENAARGRIWSGSAAKERGLVDELGGMSRAIEIAREKAHIPRGEPHHLVSFSESRLISMMRVAIGSNEGETIPTLLGRLVGIPTQWVPGLAQLLLRGGIMLLAPIIEL